MSKNWSIFQFFRRKKKIFGRMLYVQRSLKDHDFGNPHETPPEAYSLKTSSHLDNSVVKR